MKQTKFSTLLIVLLLASLTVLNAQISTYDQNNLYTYDQLGIDKVNPLDQLHIKATSNDRCIRLEENGSGTEYMTLGVDNYGNLDINRDNGPTAFTIMDANGYVGINTSNPYYNLDVNGNGRYTGDLRIDGDDITTSGDMRLNALNGGYVDVRPTDASWGLVVREYNNISDYGNIEVTPNGFGFGYRTNGAHLMIANNGYVGIGTNTPSQRLHVNGGLQIGSAEVLSDIGSWTMGINANFVPINTSNRNLGQSSRPWYNIYMNGSLFQSSDKRLKSDIKNLEYGISDIMKLRPVSYDMKDAPGEKRIGLIAQELQPVIKEVVSSTEIVRDEKTGKTTRNATEYLGVNYVDLIPVLIKGMQEQQVMIKEQQSRIDRLEAQFSSDTPAKENTVPEIKVNDAQQNSSPTGKVFQNNPNPFNTQTTINYELSDHAKQAYLIVSNMNGKQVANYELDSQQKNGQVTIQANGLPNGTYVYTLIVNGTPLATNKMVVAK